MIKGGTLFRENVYAFEFNTGRPVKQGVLEVALHQEDDERFLFKGSFEDGENCFVVFRETFSDCLADIREKVRTICYRVMRPACDLDEEEN